jgi:hypothetical protein
MMLLGAEMKGGVNWQDGKFVVNWNEWGCSLF